MFVLISRAGKNKNKKYWYIAQNISEGGKRTRPIVKSLGLCSKSEANMELSKYLLFHKDNTGDSIYLKSLFEKFDSYYKNQIDKTIKFGTYDLHCQYRRKIIYLLGHLLISDIKISDINKLKDTLATKYKLSNRTINMHLTELKKVFEYAIDNEWINHYPRIKRLPENQTIEVEALSESQIEKIYNYANEDQFFYLKIMLLTGMRPFECSNLKWKDISFEKEIISIKSDNPKKKGRIIPLHPELKAILKDKITESTSEKVSPYRTSQYAFRALKRLSNLTDIKVNPYMLRKTFASQMVIKGKHPNIIAKFMGHSNIETTNKHYIHIEVEALREIFKDI